MRLDTHDCASELLALRLIQGVADALQLIVPPPPSSAAVIVAALHILSGYKLRLTAAGTLGTHRFVEARPLNILLFGLFALSTSYDPCVSCWRNICRFGGMPPIAAVLA